MGNFDTTGILSGRSILEEYLWTVMVHSFIHSTCNFCVPHHVPGSRDTDVNRTVFLEILHLHIS